MPRQIPFFILALIFLLPGMLLAQEDDGPPIAITSPDAATTFAYGTVKDHILMWDKNNKMLTVRITFTDEEMNNGAPNEDTHYFRLPGVALDPAKGVFYAMSAKGEAIPVAHYKKQLFFTTIATMPNALIRIEHPRGIVTIILEAISPNDPAMHSPPPDSNPDDSHRVPVHSILQ